MQVTVVWVVVVGVLFCSNSSSHPQPQQSWDSSEQSFWIRNTKPRMLIIFIFFTRDHWRWKHNFMTLQHYYMSWHNYIDPVSPGMVRSGPPTTLGIMQWVSFSCTTSTISPSFSWLPLPMISCFWYLNILHCTLLLWLQIRIPTQHAWFALSAVGLHTWHTCITARGTYITHNIHIYKILSYQNNVSSVTHKFRWQ